MELGKKKMVEQSLLQQRKAQPERNEAAVIGVGAWGQKKHAVMEWGLSIG